MYLWVNVVGEESAECGIVQELPRVEGAVDVVDPREEEVGRGGAERDGPHEEDDADGALEAGHGVRVERVADGEVALHGERHDRQHRRVGRPKVRGEGSA